MASTVIYLDESGDLGWKFDAPYRAGGSSRYLTISALCVPSEKKHIPKRVMKQLYKKFKWPTKTEKKWVDMKANEREFFAQITKEMCDKYADIYPYAIVVQKENVLDDIRKDSNKLYNYMIRLALLDYMATCDVVTFIPDIRSIKVESGHSLHDYLQTELWFTKKASTNLITQCMDSKTSLGIQFADLLSGVVQSRFEDNDASAFRYVASKLNLNKLFFS